MYCELHTCILLSFLHISCLLLFSFSLSHNSDIMLGVAIGKSETHRDSETAVLKSKPETKKCNDLIEKQICDRQTQTLRLRDSLMVVRDSETWIEFAETFHFSEDHSPPLIFS